MAMPRVGHRHKSNDRIICSCHKNSIHKSRQMRKTTAKRSMGRLFIHDDGHQRREYNIFVNIPRAINSDK